MTVSQFINETSKALNPCFEPFIALKLIYKGMDGAEEACQLTTVVGNRTAYNIRYEAARRTVGTARPSARVGVVLAWTGFPAARASVRLAQKYGSTPNTCTKDPTPINPFINYSSAD